MGSRVKISELKRYRIGQAIRRAKEASMKNRIETTSETNWENLPDDWKDVAIDAMVDAGYGETPMIIVAIITSALYGAFGDYEPATASGVTESLSAIQEAFNRGKKGVTARPENCTCVQDESRNWINCPKHGEAWRYYYDHSTVIDPGEGPGDSQRQI